MTSLKKCNNKNQIKGNENKLSSLLPHYHACRSAIEQHPHGVCSTLRMDDQRVPTMNREGPVMIHKVLDQCEVASGSIVHLFWGPEVHHICFIQPSNYCSLSKYAPASVGSGSFIRALIPDSAIGPVLAGLFIQMLAFVATLGRHKSPPDAAGCLCDCPNLSKITVLQLKSP